MASWVMKPSCGKLFWWIRKQATLLLLLLAVFLSLYLVSPVLVQARAKSASASVERDYVAALAAANRFLSAWQAQDPENGLVMLTAAAKQGRSEDQLQEFFSPGADAAYEIGQGRKLKVGRYSFPVTLLEMTLGHRVHPRISQVVVVRSGKEDWAVDRLP
jgi:hypothetical protein